MNIATADLYDQHATELTSCQTQFRQYGARRTFAGPIATIRCRNDNALIKQLTSQPGNNRVLVIDGAGSLATALLGDQIATTALTQNWAGIVINGAVRDVATLRTLDLGIKALGSNPAKSTKQATGETNIPLTFGQAEFHPQSWLYSDEDGIVLATRRLH